MVADVPGKLTLGWYDVVDAPALEQGDIIRQCPVPQVKGLDGWPLAEGADVTVAITLTDLCVMTQTCDLVNDKVVDVVLCRVVSWPDARAAAIKAGHVAAKATSFRQALVQGNVPSLSLLRKHDDGPTLPWSVVDFHAVVVLPKTLVEKVASAAGPRLRLRPPYKEHLGQAFARYFMRVGLPHEAKEFVEEGKA